MEKKQECKNLHKTNVVFTHNNNNNDVVVKNIQTKRKKKLRKTFILIITYLSLVRDFLNYRVIYLNLVDLMFLCVSTDYDSLRLIHVSFPMLDGNI